jgi:hypothetical protein
MSRTRDGVKYMNEEASNKYLLNKDNISSEKTNIFNIRNNQKGLYFDLRIHGQDKDKIIKNLLIPKQVLIDETYSFNKEKKEKQILIFKYVLIYLAAVMSLIVIIDGIMKILPILKNLLGIH